MSYPGRCVLWLLVKPRRHEGYRLGFYKALLWVKPGRATLVTT
jgi:hypothetical protein